jgi:hypothetical protein
MKTTNLPHEKLLSITCRIHKNKGNITSFNNMKGGHNNKYKGKK